MIKEKERIFSPSTRKKTVRGRKSTPKRHKKKFENQKTTLDDLWNRRNKAEGWPQSFLNCANLEIYYGARNCYLEFERLLFLWKYFKCFNRNIQKNSFEIFRWEAQNLYFWWRNFWRESRRLKVWGKSAGSNQPKKTGFNWKIDAAGRARNARRKYFGDYRVDDNENGWRRKKTF